MRPNVTAEALFDTLEAAWNAARKDRALPRRQDIDAVKIGALLPYAGLIDIVPGATLDLRYRLVGARTTESYGINLTGQFHSKVTAPERMPTQFYEICRRCVETATPQTLEISNARNRKDLPFAVRARVWPLSDDGEHVTCLFGGALFRMPDPDDLDRGSRAVQDR